MHQRAVKTVPGCFGHNVKGLKWASSCLSNVTLVLRPLLKKRQTLALFQLTNYIKEKVYFQPSLFPHFLLSVCMFPHSHSPHLITTLSFSLNTTSLRKYY